MALEQTKQDLNLKYDQGTHQWNNQSAKKKKTPHQEDNNGRKCLQNCFQSIYKICNRSMEKGPMSQWNI